MQFITFECVFVKKTDFLLLLLLLSCQMGMFSTSEWTRSKIKTPDASLKSYVSVNVFSRGNS